MNNGNNALFVFDKKTDEVICFNEKELSSAVILVKNDADVILKLENLNTLKELIIKVEDNASLNVRTSLNNMPLDISIKGLLSENSILNFSVVDFSSDNIKLKSNIVLLGNNSKAVWNLSSLSFDSYVKKYNISFDHIGENTETLMNNYGVCADASTLYFDGISHIEKMAINSIANQKAKIIVYDEECRAKADPILKIDNREVVANHAAAVGTLNDMHVFYLMSRGIDLKETRNLITLGYLKPIFVNFKEDEIKNLESLLEEKI